MTIRVVSMPCNGSTAASAFGSSLEETSPQTSLLTTLCPGHGRLLLHSGPLLGAIPTNSSTTTLPFSTLLRVVTGQGLQVPGLALDALRAQESPLAENMSLGQGVTLLKRTGRSTTSNTSTRTHKEHWLTAAKTERHSSCTRSSHSLSPSLRCHAIPCTYLYLLSCSSSLSYLTSLR